MTGIFFCIGLLFTASAALGQTPDYSGSPAAGTWYGRALPDDPDNAPFAEVVMSPTFLPDGTLIANDAIEWLSPHGTAHGTWAPTPTGAEGLFIWFNLSPDAPFTGTTKIRITGTIDPDQPDLMRGTVSGVVFPPGTDPLDPDDTGGIPIGSFTIEGLRRVTLEASRPTAVEEVQSPLPAAFSLDDAFPNPFNPRTSIRFNLPFAAPVQLEIFNSRGQKVRRLFAGHLQAGSFVVDWDGTDRHGRRAGSGVYLYRLLTPTGSLGKKVLLLK